MCYTKLIIFCALITCAILHPGREARWRSALDAAKTPQELSKLSAQIQADMKYLSGEKLEIAQRFLDVIARKQVKQPYRLH